MRILLLSCNTGEGHNSTARAIMEVLEPAGAQCDLRDVLSCMSPRFSKFICNWHSRLYRYAPRISDAGYRAFERTVDPEDTTPLYEFLSLGARKLWELLMRGNYDSVICVHPFSGMMMTEVRKVYGVEIPCFFVSTDYTCSPTVEQCDMDGYFIPDSALSSEYIRVGINSLRLIPSGIPVRQGFYQRLDKKKIRKKLSLPADALVVLLMCGSMGCGPIRKVADELIQQLPAGSVVVAVCGNNEKLFSSMSEIKAPGLRVLGFCREVPDYMDAADMIVTKPGGLSATEAAVKHLPMVLINAVGGCEGRNFEFFLSRGYAVGSHDTQAVVSQAVRLAREESLRQQMQKLLQEHFPGNAAQTIAKWVLEAADQYRHVKAGIPKEKTGHPLQGKGGCTMEETLRNETLINLAKSFAGESQARTRYTVYAQVARKEGKEWIAQVFEETADNEAVHAEEFLEHLQKLGGCGDNIDLQAGYPFQLGTTQENLLYAANGELDEHDAVYPQFAEIARREGFEDTARLWMQIARIEGVHHNVFKSLHEQLASGSLTEKETPVMWRCLNCGYTYEGIRACDPCPVCGKNVGWQEGELDKKKLMPKK